MLMHPEVKKRETELEAGLEAEKIFFEYKFLREEELALTDEVIKYFNYGQLASNEFFSPVIESANKEQTKESEESAISEVSSETPHGQLLRDDFDRLLEYGLPRIEETDEEEIKWQKEYRRKKFWEFLRQIIRQSKTEEYSHGEMSKKEKEDAIIQSSDALVESLAIDLLRRDKLQELISGFTEDDIEKVKAYASAIRPDVEIALIKEGFLGGKIAQAKASKMTEGLRSAKTVAQIHGLESAAVTSVRQELMLAKDLPKSIRKHTEKIERAMERLMSQDISDEEKEELRAAIRQEKELEAEGLKAYDTNTEAASAEDIYEDTGNVVDREAIPAYVKYMSEIKRLKRLLENGKIVETDQVTAIINQAMEALQKGNKEKPQIVYFHGDFGTGKTALATHISTTRFHKNPIIVAGSKFLDPERFTEEYRLQKLSQRDHLNEILEQMGKKPLGKSESDADTIIERAFLKDELIESATASYKEMKGEDSEDRAGEEVIKGIKKDVENMLENRVQGRYCLGAMYEAMKTGTPLIIDEANAISPDVLIAFNDLLTKKIGDKIGTRTASGEIEIKPGYCIIFTGNSGERFKSARFNDIDPAFYSRILPIRVDYLPQTVSSQDSGLNDLMERFNLDELADKSFNGDEEILKEVTDIRARAKNDQIFQVLMLKLINSRLGANLLAEGGDRFKTVKDVYRLSVAARMIMDLFEHKTDEFKVSPNLSRLVGDTATTVAHELKKTNLSMRELIDNIIGSYLSDGSGMDIEWYVYKFIRSRDMTPKEQAIVMSVFQNTGFFNPTEGWEDFLTKAKNPADLTSLISNFKPLDHVEKYKKIQHNGDVVSLLNVQEKDYKLTYLNSLEVLQTIFGYLPALKTEHYGKVEAAVKKRETKKYGVENENNVDSRLAKLVGKIIENIRIIDADFFNGLEDYDAFIAPVRELHGKLEEFANQDLNDNVEAIESTCQEINDLFMVQIDKFKESNNMSAAEISAAKELDTAGQAEFINQVLKNNK